MPTSIPAPDHPGGSRPAVDDALATRLRRLVAVAFGPAATVRAIVDLAGDASTRRYVRLHLEGGSAPDSIVAMLLADRAVAISSDELASLPADLRELPYVNVHRFLERIDVPVPTLHLDAAAEGVLLLEDIGDTTLWDVVAPAHPDEVAAWYTRAIEELVRLQVAGVRAADEACIAFHQAFDRRLIRWELDHFVEWGLERRERRLPERLAAALRQRFDRLADELDAAPRALNHRDFHSWNLHVQGDRLRVIDFQDALLAPVPYDLATLLGDRDTPTRVTPDLEARLLEVYRDRWLEAGGASWVEEATRFERLYFLCALQKALKVIGRFHYLHLEKGKPGYLRYLPSTIRQFRRVAARLDDYADLPSLVEDYVANDECIPGGDA